MKYLLTYIFLFILVVFKGYGQESGGEIRIFIFDNEQLVNYIDTTYKVQISKTDSVKVNNGRTFIDYNQVSKFEDLDCYSYTFYGMSSNSKIHIRIIKNDSLIMNVYINCHFEHVFSLYIDRLIEFKEGDYYYSYRNINEINNCILIPKSSNTEYLGILKKVVAKHLKNGEDSKAKYIDDFLISYSSNNYDFCKSNETYKDEDTQFTSVNKTNSSKHKKKRKKIFNDFRNSFKYAKNENKHLQLYYYDFSLSGIELLEYLHITEKEAEKVEAFTLIGYSNNTTLPISAEVFPNLKELNIIHSFNIYNLKGLSDFKRLRSLTITCDAVEVRTKSTPIYYDFSEIWKLTELRELTLYAPVFQISDSILNLKKLKNLYLSIEVLPIELVLQMPSIEDFYYCWRGKRVDECIDLIILALNKYGNIDITEKNAWLWHDYSCFFKWFEF